MVSSSRTGTNSLRVAQVRMTDFRGVRGDLSVSFTGRTGKPSSTIVLGENGTGKSSIVDAVEWGCQGSVGRSSKFVARSRPRLFNAAGRAQSCAVEVLLSDGSVLQRHATIGENGNLAVSPIGRAAPFAHVPMSLKRADILAFLDMAPESRGSMLMHHFVEGKLSALLSVDRASDTLDVTAAAKTNVRQAAAKVAHALGVEAPFDLGEIKTMVNSQVFRSVAPQHRRSVRLPRSLEPLVEDLERALEEYEDAKRHQHGATRGNTSVTSRIQATHEILGDVGDWLTDAFRRITGAEHVAHIDVEVGRLGPVSLELDVELTTGLRGTPQRVFSEGYQDLVALLYFLAVARAAGEHGQAKVLILDDVLQSVDAGVRVRLMKLVLDQFPDWQLLITVHDRLWHSQLISLFQGAGHPFHAVEVRAWTFGGGPLVTYEGTERTLTSDLESSLDSNSTAQVCAAAGRLLEQACDTLSWALPVTVQRRRGDKYTLHHLWPGVRKALSKTTAAEVTAEVDLWSHLRNTVGAHYNEWADNVSWVDAENFGLAVLAFVEAVKCSTCGEWVASAGRGYACRCGETRL